MLLWTKYLRQGLKALYYAPLQLDLHSHTADKMELGKETITIIHVLIMKNDIFRIIYKHFVLNWRSKNYIAF